MDSRCGLCLHFKIALCTAAGSNRCLCVNTGTCSNNVTVKNVISSELKRARQDIDVKPPRVKQDFNADMKKSRLEIFSILCPVKNNFRTCFQCK